MNTTVSVPSIWVERNDKNYKTYQLIQNVTDLQWKGKETNWKDRLLASAKGA